MSIAEMIAIMTGHASPGEPMSATPDDFLKERYCRATCYSASILRVAEREAEAEDALPRIGLTSATNIEPAAIHASVERADGASKPLCY